jgi:hypothetical protein
MTYLSSKNYSLVLEYISSNLELGLLELITGELLVNKIKPNNQTEIELNLDSSGGLFGEESVSRNYLLVDLCNIDIKALNWDFFGNNESSTSLIFFDSINELNADSKKFLKIKGVELLDLKSPDVKTKEEFIEKYCTILDMESKVKNAIIPKISQFCSDYYEIINWLDFAAMSDSSDNQIDKICHILTPEESVMTFKLGLKDTKHWMINDEGELQKNLSILATKSQSQKNKNYIAKIIQTDKNVKTRSKVKALTWYKLLLWQIKNS